MIAIKHRFAEQTLCEFDVETIKEAAEKGKADLESADLRGANLRGANLESADLYGADMYGAELDGEKITKTPLSVSSLRYWCLISDNYMRLACRRYTHDEWAAFDDAQICAMGIGALEFWKQWKEPLLSMCRAHRGDVK